MKIVIASGKGGTGKTTIAVNLASYLAKTRKERVILLDCDVESPDDNLFINASFSEIKDVIAQRPRWNKELCSSCGKCVSTCQYNAIAKAKDNILIFNELCHSCGACAYLCPEKALIMEEVSIGKIELAMQHKPFSFGHGVLKIGETLAPTVIQKLKEQIDENCINILDSSPGTACPVVKTMENMDYCLLVTEPTPFGLHDLQLAASLTEKMKIPTAIIINRSYNDDAIIEDFAKKSNIPIIGKIPFKRKYAESYSRGEILVDEFPELKETFASIYEAIQKIQLVPKCPPIIEKSVKCSTSILTSDDNRKNPCQHKEITVISGKGGTGKTTIVAILSELMKNKVLADNDVDASNLYLLCPPTVTHSKDFIGGKKYTINQDACIKCGKCQEICNFDAVNSVVEDKSINYSINEFSCEGCGFCYHICPVAAITSKDAISGKSYISETKQGPLSHAKLGIAEENSGKLVSLVRSNASKLAKQFNSDKILSDGPPGTSCPVIASITGVDLALIVTEPTLSGIHDLKRILDLTKHFNIKSLIVINKFDLNKQLTDEIIEIAAFYQTKVIGKIPFDKSVIDALINLKNIIDYGKGEAYKSALDFWKRLQEELNEL